MKDTRMYVWEDIIVFMLGMTIIFIIFVLFSRRKRYAKLLPINPEWVTENSYLTPNQWQDIADYRNKTETKMNVALCLHLCYNRIRPAVLLSPNQFQTLKGRCSKWNRKR